MTIQSMSGALFQLIAKGAETTYLSGNPSITFFKSVYKQHTNFAMEHTETVLDGSQSLSRSTKTTLKVKIDRTGDLLKDCALCITLPDIYSSTSSGFRWIPLLGFSMIEEVRLLIGPTIVQRISGEQMFAMGTLRYSNPQKDSLRMLSGSDISAYEPNCASGYPAASITNGTPSSAPSIPGRRLIIPLDFYFSKDAGLALPLIALQYHEVQVEIDLRKYPDLYTVQALDDTDDSNLSENTYYRKRPEPSTSGEDILDFIANEDKSGSAWNMRPTLLATYVFLDNSEREAFATSNHSYLISYPRTIIETGVSNSKQFELNLFHPVKNLIFACRRSDVRTRSNQWLNFTNLEDITSLNDNEDEQNLLNAFQLYYSQSSDFADFVTTYVDGSRTLPPFGGNSFRTLDAINFRNLWKYRSINEIPQITQSNYSSYQKDIITSAKLIFNGNDRFRESDSQYFQRYIPFYYFRSGHDGLNTYSFATKPLQIYPTGAANFSQISKAELLINVTTPPSTPINYSYELFIMAEELNVLDILGGMGSLKYAN